MHSTAVVNTCIYKTFNDIIISCKSVNVLQENRVSAYEWSKPAGMKDVNHRRERAY